MTNTNNDDENKMADGETWEEVKKRGRVRYGFPPLGIKRSSTSDDALN